MSNSVSPWIASRQISLSFTISQSLLQLMSTELMMTSNHLILCCPLLLLSSVFPGIGVFSNESVLPIGWRKYWSFSFNISHSIEYSRWILFRIDWFNLFPVQGTLKNLLQHHSSKALILQCSPFFMVQLSIILRCERDIKEPGRQSLDSSSTIKKRSQQFLEHDERFKASEVSMYRDLT